jgi:hypothetical protein
MPHSIYRDPYREEAEMPDKLSVKNREKLIKLIDNNALCTSVEYGFRFFQAYSNKWGPIEIRYHEGDQKIIFELPYITSYKAGAKGFTLDLKTNTYSSSNEIFVFSQASHVTIDDDLVRDIPFNELIEEMQVDFSEGNNKVRLKPQERLDFVKNMESNGAQVDGVVRFRGTNCKCAVMRGSAFKGFNFDIFVSGMWGDEPVNSKDAKKRLSAHVKSNGKLRRGGYNKLTTSEVDYILQNMKYKPGQEDEITDETEKPEDNSLAMRQRLDSMFKAQ